MPAKPPTVVNVLWTRELKFEATSGHHALVLDSGSIVGPSPVQILAVAVASCMSVDVVHILQRGRHAFRAFKAAFTGDRAQEDPHRFVAMRLHLTVEGDVPRDVVERAAALSREKYCSVWHSMRHDIDFQVTVDVVP